MKISEKLSEARVLCSLLVLIAILFSITPVHNGNIFWHLRNGIDIVETGEIRTEDPFTWTRQGAYWIQHEWLAEAVMALAWIHTGEAGLVLLKALFIGLSVFFVFKASLKNGGNPGFAFVFGVFWLTLAQPRWITRPHFFSIFFFSLYLYVLSFDIKKSWKLALILFPIQVLWVNVHAGFVMGLFLASVPAMKKLLTAQYKEFVNWLIPPVFLLLASGIHPNGFRTLEYLPAFLAQPLFKQSIREWWSPFDPRYAPEKILSRTAILFSALTIGTTALLAKFPEKIDRGKLLALLMLTLATVFAARNGELLAPAMLAWVPGMLNIKLSKKIGFATAIMLLIVPFVYGVPREIGPPRELGAYVDWSVYPVELADLLEAHPAILEKAKVFNTNEISGYLEYRFGERFPLFVDGRCLLFPEDFHWDYLMISEAPSERFKGFQRNLFDKYGFNLLIYNTLAPSSSVYLAAALPEWVPIHINGLSSTYAKWSLLQETNLEYLGFRYFDPLDPGMFLTTPLYLQPLNALSELIVQRDQLGINLLDGVIESFYFRNDTSYTIQQNLEPNPWTSTLECWVACREGDLSYAAEQAEISGDPSLQAAVSFLQTGVLEENQAILGISNNTINSEWSEKAVLVSALWVTGDQVQALELSHSIIDSLPPWGIAQSAWLYSLKGQQNYAEELAALALSKAQGPIVLGKIAKVYRTGEDYIKAIEYCRRALVLSPNYTEVRMVLANSLWDINSIEEAVTEYKELINSGLSLPDYVSNRIALVEELQNVQLPAGREGL